MPQVGKQALAQFIRTNCLRQLALNLYPDNATFRPDRQAFGMPYPQSPRPGLRQVQAAGEEWQAEKLHDLTQAFGANAIVGTSYVTPANQTRYSSTPLGQALPQATPTRFLVEAEFPVLHGGAFQTALGIAGNAAQLNLQYANLRPDVVAVLQAGTFPSCITPDGTVVALPAGDNRLQLRVIDIKMTAEGSPVYFAEVAYYGMALAGWLSDQGLDQQFVVVPFAAVWPGSHDASNLLRVRNQILAQGLQPSVAQLWDAMQEDLEPVPFEVFSFRVRRFFQVDVPGVLTRPWQGLEWHVDNRCSFCEYLGENRPPSPHDPHAAPHPDHCLPAAQASDHLSRVAFVSQGARLSLSQAGVMQVNALAQLQHTDPVFESHQALRATRTVVAGRARSLQTGQVAIPPLAGTSAGMPRWADLHLYLSVDFDIGSAITVAFGLHAFWYEPRPIQSPLTSPRVSQAWHAVARIVVDRDPAAESRELLAFLQQIHDILDWCRQRDQQTLAHPALAGLAPNSSQRQEHRTKVQFYVWDTLQFEHLAKVVGRHLQAILANQNINYLAWLFPPEDVLQNPDMATRRSPITIVRDVIRGLLAAPVAHYYSLLEIARAYHDANLPPAIAAFNIHPLFGTPLSDQIPSERAHEIWARRTAPPHWQQQMAVYAETVRKRLAALETVTKRLESDLRNQLAQVAPVIEIGPPARQTRVSDDGQLWYAFARLNKALEELEVHQIRAMPPHERAARFRSARLPQRLVGAAEQAALAQMGLQPRAWRRVYMMAADSRDVKVKVGDFAFALSPESMAGLLDRKVSGVVRGTPLETQMQAALGNWFWQARMEGLLDVTVAGLDRNLGLLALDPNARFPQAFDQFQNFGVANFDVDVVLDPVHHDFFTAKLLAALQAIGNPPIARNNANPGARAATGQGRRRARATNHTSPADFLWGALNVAGTPVARQLGPTRAALSAHLATVGRNLNATQWQAWEDALSYRARLIWGPPGTGKSLTVRAIVGGAVHEARRTQRPMRVLVSASTYTAIDNVLLDIARDLAALAPGACDVVRLRSVYQEQPANIAPAIDAELSRGNPSQLVRNLRTQLQSATGCVVVGATPEQVHNLLTCDNGSAQAEWFDLIVIDEASQMDVAHAILPFSAIAGGASVVLAGDHLQLPPIHQAEPPAGLEDFVGSVYRFWQGLHQVPESALGINYRSNDTLVSFARHTGYQSTLASHSPNLRMDLLSALPQTLPPNWPATLLWTSEWSALLDPAQPAACFVYDDGRSSQRNAFEADAVASMLRLLHGRLANQLRNENDAATGVPAPPSATPYGPIEFWERAVGVVTPHRAQQGLIVTRLQQVFGATGQLAAAIRDAVDTVERFQGQQRDIIIASYTLGDPDQIAEEDEFLMSLNRFNVIASRARAKLVVLVSREVVNHLAHDLDVLRESRLLKVYVETFCNNARPMTLGHVLGPGPQMIPGSFRWRV